MDYTIFSTEGRILAMVGCHESELQHHVDKLAGVGALEGSFNWGTHYVSNGHAAPLPLAPSPHHRFNYTNKQWEDPRTAATEWPLVRATRDALLADTDWVVTKALELGTPVPDAWKTYRQALRNVTAQPDPFNLVWPVMPP